MRKITLKDVAPIRGIITLDCSLVDKKSLVMETTILDDGEFQVFFCVKSEWETIHTTLASAIDDYNKR